MAGGRAELDLRALAASAPSRNRTCDTALRRRVLYPLSYRGATGPPGPGRA
jgi:hypothetical protein